MSFGWFYVLRLLPIGFTQQNLCCIGKSMMKRHKNRIGKWGSNLDNIVMDIGSAFLLTYIGPHSCVHH